MLRRVLEPILPCVLLLAALPTIEAQAQPQSSEGPAVERAVHQALGEVESWLRAARRADGPTPSEEVRYRQRRRLSRIAQAAASLSEPEAQRWQHKVSVLLRQLDDLRHQDSPASSDHALRGSPTSWQKSGTCGSAAALRDGDWSIPAVPASGLWLRHRAERTGPFRASTRGSEVDLSISVYSACPEAGGRLLAAGDDESGLDAIAGWTARKGEERWIALRSEWPRGGTVRLAVGPSGGLSGTVTGGGSPLAGVEVYAWRDASSPADLAVTNASGFYEVSALTPGTYFVTTSNAAPYLNELYDDLPCTEPTFPACDPVTGSPVTVGAGSTTAGIDFDLSLGGSIRGRITDITSSPLPGVEVHLRDALGRHVAIVMADGAGDYGAVGLPAGDYYANTQTDDYRDEIWDDFPCTGATGCPSLLGDRITVETGLETTGIDFELEELGGISGQVTLAASGDPVPFPVIEAYRVNGPFVDLAAVAVGLADGTYDFGGLYPEDLVVATALDESLRDEVYDDRPCVASSGCPVESGDPVTVLLGAVTTGIDFAVDEKAQIEGTVTDAATGAPIADAYMRLWTIGGDEVAATFTGTDGSYRFTALWPNTYAVTSLAAAHFNQVYDSIPCDPACDPTAGTPIVAAFGTLATGIDFSLSLAGAIRGSLSTANTGSPLTGAVGLYRPPDSPLVTNTDALGEWSFLGLEAGTYWAVSGNDQGYIDEVYDDVPCEPSCDAPALGTPIVVGEGEQISGIAMALDDHSIVSGTVTQELSGLPLFQARVTLYNQAGTRLGSAFSDENGEYSLPRAQPGILFARATLGDDFEGELYDDLPCPDGCDPTTGTGIPVALASETIGIDFSLSLALGVRGQVVESGTGLPIVDATVHVWTASGGLWRTLTTGPTGHYAAPVRFSGTYFVSTDNGAGLVDQVFDGISCPGGPAVSGGCDPTQGTPIVISSAAPIATASFTLAGPIFADGFESGDTTAWTTTVVP